MITLKYMGVVLMRYIIRLASLTNYLIFFDNLLYVGYLDKYMYIKDMMG